MATMYDAVTPANIPASAEVVAGYVDGHYAWKPADWARFPHALKVRIAVFPSTNDGDVLDVEPGDATPAQAPGWVARRRAAGHPRPTVYCSRSAWPAVRAEFARQRVPEPDYWIADYTGRAHLLPGSVATQWTDAGPYDVSITNGVWPRTTAPAPPVRPIIEFPPYQEDAVKTALVHIGNLDAEGCGWGAWDPGFARSPVPVAAVAAGPRPAADHSYWLDMDVNVRLTPEDNHLIISVTRGKPGADISVYVTAS